MKEGVIGAVTWVYAGPVRPRPQSVAHPAVSPGHTTLAMNLERLATVQVSNDGILQASKDITYGRRRRQRN